MSDAESENEDSNPMNSEGSSTNKNRRGSLRRRENNNKKSAVECYIERILTQLSSSSSNESTDDDKDSTRDEKSEDSDASDDDDDTDWSSASDDNENIENENTEKKIKLVVEDQRGKDDVLSDSSDGATEKCPICLLSFRNQEIGIPESCDHKFCFICIEEWSKNVSTCPIDRKNFSIINVKDNYESRKVTRKIKVEIKSSENLTIDVDLTFCEVCRNSDREDCMLLCDECNRGYHLYCLSPPLEEVPQGSWYCDNCFSSESSYSDNEVEALLEDVRDLGEPSTRLRTPAIRTTPRITRTRQSERIRAAIIARTRISRNPVRDPSQPSTSSGFGSIIDTISRRISRNNTGTRRRTSKSTTVRRRTTKCKRRTFRSIKKTIIEYGIDNDNNKFPIEIISKISKRRKRRKKRCRKPKTMSSNRRTRIEAKTKELVKTVVGNSRTRDLLSKLSIPQLSVFGARDQLDYFSSDDDESNTSSNRASRDVTGMTGGSTLTQTVTRNRVGSRRVLNRQKSMALNIDTPFTQNTNAPIDLLSSILETQERWHSNRNLENVRIKPDGTLLLEKNETKSPIKNTPETPPVSVNPDSIVQAPVNPRGGGGFRNSVGGYGSNTSRGFYNNNNSNNSGGYRRNSTTDGGGGNQSSSNYRSSTDGNFNSNYSSTFNNNYNNSTYNNLNEFRSGFSPFQRGRGRNPNQPNPNFTPRTPINLNTRFPLYSRRSINVPPINRNLPFFNEPSSSVALQNEEVTESQSITYQPANIQLTTSSSAEFVTTTTTTTVVPTLCDNEDIENIELPTSTSSENIVSSSNTRDMMEDDEDETQIPDNDILTQQNPNLIHLKIDDEHEILTQVNPRLVKHSNEITEENAILTQVNPRLVKKSNDIDDEDDDCPNFSVYSAVSMDIAKESENSSQGASEVQINKPNPRLVDYDDEEKEEDLVQLDDDDIEDEIETNDNQTEVTKPEEIVESAFKSNETVEPAFKSNEDDGDDDDDDDNDDDKKETPPNPLIEKNIPPTHNTSNKISNKKEKVLELYDDSDWDEWNIEKNDDEKLPETQKSEENVVPVEQITENLTESISEDERSYTPCLDEKQQKFDPLNKSNSNNISSTPEPNSSNTGNNKDNEDKDEQSTTPIKPAPSSGIGGMDTEMISDDDEEEIFNDNHTNNNNYIGQKDDRNPKMNKKRFGNNSFKKISKSTKERNYRDRDNKKRRRSRSNDKENHNQRTNKLKVNKKKDKRKDLERYNVRNVIVERPRPLKDKYGRDLTARPANKSPSKSRSRDRRSGSRRSGSHRRSPFRRSYSRRRSFSPRRKRSTSKDRRSRSRRRSQGKARKKSRSPAGRFNGKQTKRGNKKRRSRSHSTSRSRTPSLSRSRSFSISCSRSPIERPPPPVVRRRSIERKSRRKERRRVYSIERSPSPRPAPVPTKKKIAAVRRRHARSKSWSPNRRAVASWSRSKSPVQNIVQELTWTPPPINQTTTPTENLTVILKNKETLRKKKEKKRKAERKKEQLEKRKEKRRQRNEKQPSPIAPSKEVFASGNNILVSVSFNKNQEFDQPQQQTTVVTLPASRSQIITTKRRNEENQQRKSRREKNKDGSGKRHKKVDFKPVAIIDLDRSPFKELTPSPKAVIILSDSDNENQDKEKRKTSDNTIIQVNSVEEISDQQMSVEQASQPQSPLVDDSFDDLQLTGPKTPPEPTLKFSMSVKPKASKLRPINPLHDAIEEEEENMLEEENNAQKDLNKIGPNTPPEPAPTSPDAYDPFEPTKSPSPSPSPAPPDIGDISTNDDDICDNIVESTQDSNLKLVEEQGKRQQQQQLQQQEKIINPAELVMQLMNAKSTVASSSAHADITSTSGDNFNISNDNQPIEITSVQTSPNDKNDEPLSHHQKSITVLSNVLLQQQTGANNSSQRGANINNLLIPNITTSGRSPIKSLFSNNPTSTTNKQSPIKSMQKGLIQKSKVGNNNQTNRFAVGGGTGNDEVNVDLGSPYSPGSSDYDDLFEPPMDSGSPPPPELTIREMNKRKTSSTLNKNTSSAKQNSNNNNSNPFELFNNLFGSTSPLQPLRMSSKYKRIVKTNKKTPVKVFNKGPQMGMGMGKFDEDQLKILDDLPSSAVELQVKDKFLRKLNRQERVVEEVKLVLKPHYNKKHVTKEEYKDILRRAVPKICHNRAGEINPMKIHALIEAYVKKFRHKRKFLNNGVVSSSNKSGNYNMEIF